LAIPTQSTAHKTIGCPLPTSTIPRALRGSTISLAGGTAPSQSGLPNGGVASTWKVAISNRGASAETVSELAPPRKANTRQQTLKRQNMVDYRSGRKSGASGNIDVWIISQNTAEAEYRYSTTQTHVTPWLASRVEALC
jgi:hypothetical protein